MTPLLKEWFVIAGKILIEQTQLINKMRENKKAAYWAKHYRMRESDVELKSCFINPFTVSRPPAEPHSALRGKRLLKKAPKLTSAVCQVLLPLRTWCPASSKGFTSTSLAVDMKGTKVSEGRKPVVIWVSFQLHHSWRSDEVMEIESISLPKDRQVKHLWTTFSKKLGHYS